MKIYKFIMKIHKLYRKLTYENCTFMKFILSQVIIKPQLPKMKFI